MLQIVRRDGLEGYRNSVNACIKSGLGIGVQQILSARLVTCQCNLKLWY